MEAAIAKRERENDAAKGEGCYKTWAAVESYHALPRPEAFFYLLISQNRFALILISAAVCRVYVSACLMGVNAIYFLQYVCKREVERQ